MWIRTISFAVGVHRHTSPFTHANSRTDTFKGEELIESCCIVFQPKVSQEGIAGGEMLASRVPVFGTKDGGRGWWLRMKNTCRQFKFTLNQILPTLFTPRNEESKIIAVMSSHVDDLLCCYLPEGAEATNSVLQNFLVGKKNMVPSGFVVKNFDKTRTLVFMSRLKTALSEYNQSLTTRNMA